MREKIRKLFYKESINESFIVTLLVYIKQKVTVKSTSNEIERRGKLDIFNYKEISQPLQFYPYYFIEENNFYGNAKCLFEKYKTNACLKPFTRIEHSTPYAWKHIPSFKINDFSKVFITLSDNRIKYLKPKMNKKLIAVGPYIIHAKNILSESAFTSLKEKLGKTLVVFPSHSIDNLHSSYDSSQFIDYIQKVKNTIYKSVIVCLYWKDIELGRAIDYEAMGYKVVTAGHLYDYNFINRLKTIILLADYTISNNVGTHVGYSVALGKPHFIFQSKINMIMGKDSKHEKIVEKAKDSYDNLEQDINRVRAEVINLFSNEETIITEEQKECVRKYWGNFN